MDDTDDPGDVIDAMALARFIAGVEPAARTVRLNRLDPSATLLPPGVEPSWRAQDGSRLTLLAQGDGWTLRVVRWSDRSADLITTATTDELARRILDSATQDAVLPTGDEDRAVTVGFWHQRRCGTADRAERSVAIEPWPAIRRNYTAAAASALEAIIATSAGDMVGRLLLLHGPPGTGKTTALGALAHAWRDWCRLEVVLDPERLLTDAGYLMAVALGEDHDKARQWQLIVLEDCDELLRADAKKDTGQALARLLNMTDGIVGQGMSVLVALTTNEPISQLHPAIVRPGRCLAEIAVGRLSRQEALGWLGWTDGVGAEGATLAELFVHQGRLRSISSGKAPVAAGQYL